MRPARWTTIFLLLAVPLALGVGPGLSADPVAGGLTIRIPPSDEPMAGYVVVSYEDTIAGDVIERVVPIEVSPKAGVELNIGQLRPDVNVSVRLLDRDAIDDLVQSGAGLVNGTLGTALKAVEGLDLGHLLPTHLPLALHAYPYAPIATSSRDKGIHYPRVLMAPNGVLGVAYVGSDFENGSKAEPFLRMSTDLGHRFGANLPLAPGTNTIAGSPSPPFASNVGLDGAFWFVTGHHDDAWRLQAFTTTRVDPVTQVVTASRHEVPAGLRQPGYTPLVLSDGSVIIVSQGTMDVSRFDAAGGDPTTVDIEPDATFRGSAHVWAGSAAGGKVAVAWSVVKGSGSVLRVATSQDGGRSWTSPVNVTGLPAGADAPAIASGAIDELGAVHLAVLVPQGDLANTMRYVEVPPLGAPIVHELDMGDEPVRYVPQAFLAAAGGRVWILAQVAAPSDITIQGNTGSYRTQTMAWERLPGPLGAREPREFEVQGTSFFHFEGQPALMPDGRLVVLGSSGTAYSVVPTFDPFPEPGCGVRDGTTSTPTPSPGVMVASYGCDEHFSLQSIAGAVQVRSLGTDQHAGGPDSFAFPDAGLPDGAVQAGAAAVAVAAIVGLSSLEAVRYGLGLAAASLFSRVQGKKVLQHAIRGGIHDHVVANPGIRFKQIRKDLGLSHGTTAYHLRVLERNGLLRARTVWTTRHYEPVAAGKAVPALPANDVILDFLRRNPGAGPSDVARDLGISRQLAHYHLRRLARAGRLGPSREA